MNESFHKNWVWIEVKLTSVFQHNGHVLCFGSLQVDLPKGGKVWWCGSWVESNVYCLFLSLYAFWYYFCDFILWVAPSPLLGPSWAMLHHLAETQHHVMHHYWECPILRQQQWMHMPCLDHLPLPFIIWVLCLTLATMLCSKTHWLT